MSVNVKTIEGLQKIASNVSITQANWSETDTSKNSCIVNKPATLTTIEEIEANTNNSALAGANAVKELNQKIDDYDYTLYVLEPTEDIESAYIHVEKKNGWCRVFGNIKPIKIDGTTLHILRGLPKPRTGYSSIIPSVISNNTYYRPAYIGVDSSGDLIIRYGSNNIHYFESMYCYIEE